MARLVQYPVQSLPKRMQGKSLLDELANPPFSALLFVSLSPHSGQDDDGCPWVNGPDLLEHFESLHLGHREVENRDIGVFLAKHLDPPSPAGCEQDVVALPPQNGIEEITDALLIVHNKNLRHQELFLATCVTFPPWGIVTNEDRKIPMYDDTTRGSVVQPLCRKYPEGLVEYSDRFTH